MKIVTYNIRCQFDGCDEKNNFIHRAGLIYQKFTEEKPDVVAFQEMTAPILECLRRLLPEYDFFGSGRLADYTGEGLYTAVRKDTCAVLSYDVFWLSPTPYVAGSRFENQSECPRSCVTLKVRDVKTNALHRSFNVHLDHISDEARQNGLKCLFEFVDRYNALDPVPVVILGDFNAEPDSKTMRFCFARKDLTEVTGDFKYTWHAFGDLSKATKIDYIFLSNEIASGVKATAWTDEKHGIYLSDHFPVGIVLS